MKETLEEEAEKSFGEIWASLTTEQSKYLKGYINRQRESAIKWKQERIYSDGIDLFIAEIKSEFKDDNWNYLEFIKERVLVNFKNNLTEL